MKLWKKLWICNHTVFIKVFLLISYVNMVSVFSVLQCYTLDNSTFTRLTTCESCKSFIFCVAHHLEVWYTSVWCILSKTSVQISFLKCETDLTLQFMVSFQSKKHWNCALPHTHQIIWYGYCSEETYYLHLQIASWRCRQYIPLKHCYTQTTRYPNLDHFMFLHHCENLK